MAAQSAPLPIDDVLAFLLKLDGIIFTTHSQKLDRAGLIACHYAAAEEARKLMTRRDRESQFTYRLLYPEKRSAPLSTLTPMFLWESSEDILRVGSTNLDQVLYSGRVLYGRLCVRPFMTAGVHTVLEDISGSGVLLVIDNAVCTTESQKYVWSKYPDGLAVAIKEPLLTKLWSDGTIGLKVANPADIVPLKDRFLFLRAMQAIRCGLEGILNDTHDALIVRGRIHWDLREWSRAAVCFTIGAKLLERCQEKLQEDLNGTTGLRTTDVQRALAINEVKLVQIYGKISDACVRLGRYKKVLDNADKALQLSPNHVDSLLRRARALTGMQRYDEAIRCLKVVQASSVRPLFEPIAQAAAQQAREGIYQLQWEDLHRGIYNASEFETYVGPIEIRMASQNGGRGMFATRDVRPGELLLVSKPLTRGSPRARGPRLEFLCNQRDQNPGPQEILCQLSEEKYNATVQMIAKAQESPQYATQMKSLQHGFVTKQDLPPMSLFTEDWDDDKYGDVSSPENQELLEISVETAHVRGAVQTNAFVEDRDNAPVYVYGLSSFFNHSCSPNCFQYSLGDFQFMSSSCSVSAGEMLTISYFSTVTNFNYRMQASMKHFGQKCDCVRCKFEEQAITEIPALEALLTRYCKDFAVGSFDVQDVRSPVYRNKCFQVRTELETIFNSEECKAFSEESKDWIRASFAQVYVLPLLGFPRLFDKDWLDEVVRLLTSVIPGSLSLIGTLAILHEFLVSVDREGCVKQHFLQACANLYLPVERDFNNLLNWAHQRAPIAFVLKQMVTSI